MRYLAIDTSRKSMTVVLCDNGKFYEFFDKDSGTNHSVMLMPKVEELLETAKLKVDDLDFLVAVVGAGSFTGIRIGVSTVKALCYALNKPFLSITSFDTLAYNSKENVLAVIDAGHNGYYVAGYSDYKLTFNPAYVLKDQLNKLSEKYTLVSESEIKDFSVTVVDVLSGLKKAIDCNLDKIDRNLDNLSPLYIRQSQAEEGRL